MLRSRLLPALAAVALALGACATDDAPEPGGFAPEEGTTTEESTEAPDDAPARGEAGENPANPDADATGGVVATGDEEVPTPDEDQPVVLAFDGRPVPLAEACGGVDGAIRATTEGEVTVTLVREEGVTLRYEAEGTSAETDEVEVDDSQDDTVYTATLSSDDVDPLAVTMTVAADAHEQLPPC